MKAPLKSSNESTGESMRIVIIGGSTAGTLCALELRKMDKDAEITILEKGKELQFSPCAMPYVLSGEIKSIDQIRLMSKKDYEDNGIGIQTSKEVKRIDDDNKEILLNDGNISYDKLVIATGSRPYIPEIEIEDGADVRTFKTLEDLSGMMKGKPKDVTVIGAGLIGIEVAHALAEKSKVTVIEAQDQALPSMLDADMAGYIEEEMEAKKIRFLRSSKVSKIGKGYVQVGEEKIRTDSVIMAAGFVPETSLAEDSGLKVGKGISVDDHMRTSKKDIYACGDCIEWKHAITGELFLSQLATTALEQARIASRSILGSKSSMKPILNTGISKAGDIFFGSLGITRSMAKEKGIECTSARYSSFNTAEYYAKDSRLIVKLIAGKDRKLIGAQLVSDQNIAGHLNMLSLIAGKGMLIDELMHIETCYNPASNPLHDPIRMCAEILDKKLSMKNKKG